MANIPGMGSGDEKELPSLKELYVGFSDLVRRTREGGRTWMELLGLNMFAAGLFVLVEFVHRTAGLGAAAARKPGQRGGDVHQLALPDGAALSVL